MTQFHYRSEIKQGIENALLGATLAGINVEISRRIPVREGDYPLITIYTPEETAERISRESSEYRKTCTIHIRCFTDKEDGVGETDLDTLSNEIESILNAIDPQDILAGGSDIFITSTSIDIHGQDNVQGFAVALLTYSFIYYVESDDPTPDDLATVDVISKLNKPPERP